MIKKALKVIGLLIILVQTGALAQVEQVYVTDSAPQDIDFIDDTMFFVTQGQSGIPNKVMKIENLNGTHQISVIASDVGLYPRAIEVVNNILYFSTSSYLKKIDLSNSDFTPVDIVYGNGIKSILHKDNILYLAESDKISIIDLSQNPISKENLFTDFEYFPLSFANYGDEIYVAHGYKISKFNVYDQVPVLQDVLTNLPSKIYGMDVYENELFFDQTWPLNPSNGRYIAKFDITDANPEIVQLNIELPLHTGSLNFHAGNIYLIRAVTKEILKINNSYLGLPEFDLPSMDLRLFPNPANDYIQLLNQSQDENFSVFDLLGNQVLSGELKVGETININKLSKGLYILILKQSVKSYKFLKN